jgi:minor extracellular serine protease Vpr
MKKILATLLIFSAIGLGVVAFGVRGGSPRPNANADAFNRGPDVDRSSAVVQLKGDPISTNPSTKPAHGRKIDFKSNGVKSYRAQLNAQRNEFKRWLRANAPRAKVTSKYDVSLNAVAVQLNGTPLATIAAAPMVQSAGYNTLYYPNLSQSYKIINAMAAWTAAGGRTTAGAGIKIGDIDSGIEETHPFFAPTGFSYPPGFPKCDAEDSNSHHKDQDCKHVTPKVIVAKVFFNKAGQQGLDATAVEGTGLTPPGSPPA